MRFDSWDEFMAEQRRSRLLGRISDAVTAERAKGAVYPPRDDVFAFTATPLRDVKVVILGQDPYHQPGQAHGLAFSVRAGVALPPSLRNILRELDADLWENQCWGSSSSFPPNLGDLTPWTRQGVLLLNTALTVRHGEPGSHCDIWQPFTDEVLRAVVDSAAAAPHFILWGRTQCMLSCGVRRHVAYIPTRFAKVGQLVTIDCMSGLWRVDATYTTLSTSTAIERSRDHARQRDYSDA